MTYTIRWGRGIHRAHGPRRRSEKILGQSGGPSAWGNGEQSQLDGADGGLGAIGDAELGNDVLAALPGWD